MSLHPWITGLACMGQLSLVILVVIRGPKAPLTLPFALSTGVVFSWNFASLAYEVTGQPAWMHLDFVLSPQVVPVLMLFALTFLGRRRQLRWLLFFIWLAFTALSVTAALRWMGAASLSLPVWGAAEAVLILSSEALVFGLLLIHLREAVGDAERICTRTLILGFAVFAVLGVTEIGNFLWPEVPRLGSLGSLLCAWTFARVAMGLDLFGTQQSVRMLGFGVLWGVLGVVAFLGFLAGRGAGQAVLVFAFITGALVLVVAGRQLVGAVLERWARMSQSATLGHFSAQMAHDLKNPLAALKGALQFIQEERARGGDIRTALSMLDLMEEQVDRIHRVIDTYQRLGKVEPLRQPVALNELVRSVCGLQSLAPPPGVTLRKELAEGLPELQLDPELIASSLENLVHNALQAMPRGGQLTVRTAHGDGPGTVVLAVQDTGVGMDARTRERAFDPFFTTRADGTGIGLPFVRRVVEAHGGQLTLTSRVGQGTLVRMIF